MSPNSPEALVDGSVVPQISCDSVSFQPISFCSAIVDFDVGVALCNQAPQAQFGVVAHDRVLQLFIDKTRKVHKGQRFGF